MQNNTTLNSEMNVSHKQENEQGLEIDLVELAYHLFGKIKYIIIISILGALCAGLYSQFMITPKYEAASKIYIASTGNSLLSVAELNLSNNLAQDYIEVFSTWHMRERIIKDLDLPYTYSQLGKMVSITNPSGTHILKIKVTSTDPKEAEEIANAYAVTGREFIAERMATEMPVVFEEARVPNAPSSPNKSKNTVLGFIGGFLLSCAIFVIKFILDDRIHSADEVEKYLGIPALGMIPQQKTGSSSGKSSHSSGKRRK